MAVLRLLEDMRTRCAWARSYVHTVEPDLRRLEGVRTRRVRIPMLCAYRNEICVRVPSYSHTSCVRNKGVCISTTQLVLPEFWITSGCQNCWSELPELLEWAATAAGGSATRVLEYRRVLPELLEWAAGGLPVGCQSWSTSVLPCCWRKLLEGAAGSTWEYCQVLLEYTKVLSDAGCRRYSSRGSCQSLSKFWRVLLVVLENIAKGSWNIQRYYQMPETGSIRSEEAARVCRNSGGCCWRVLSVDWV